MLDKKMWGLLQKGKKPCSAKEVEADKGVTLEEAVNIEETLNNMIEGLVASFKIVD